MKEKKKTLQQGKKSGRNRFNNKMLIILKMVDGYTGAQYTTSFTYLHV